MISGIIIAGIQTGRGIEIETDLGQGHVTEIDDIETGTVMIKNLKGNLVYTCILK